MRRKAKRWYRRFGAGLTSEAKAVWTLDEHLAGALDREQFDLMEVICGAFGLTVALRYIPGPYMVDCGKAHYLMHDGMAVYADGALVWSMSCPVGKWPLALSGKVLTTAFGERGWHAHVPDFRTADELRLKLATEGV